MFDIVINVFVELLGGYVLFYVLGYLNLIPEKDKIQNVINKKGIKENKKEIKNVRKWFCLAWTVLVIGFNLFIIL